MVSEFHCVHPIIKRMIPFGGNISPTSRPKLISLPKHDEPQLFEKSLAAFPPYQELNIRL